MHTSATNARARRGGPVHAGSKRHARVCSHPQPAASGHRQPRAHEVKGWAGRGRTRTMKGSPAVQAAGPSGRAAVRMQVAQNSCWIGGWASRARVRLLSTMSPRASSCQQLHMYMQYCRPPSAYGLYVAVCIVCCLTTSSGAALHPRLLSNPPSRPTSRPLAGALPSAPGPEDGRPHTQSAAAHRHGGDRHAACVIWAARAELAPRLRRGRPAGPRGERPRLLEPGSARR